MELPSGFLSIVLTDIAGSTAAWDADPEATDVALQHHDAVLGAVVAAHDGRVLKQKGEGDSTFSVFEDPVDAVCCAVAFLAQLRDDDFPLSVRVAVHAGEMRPREGDYFGPVPNRAARIRGLSPGNQVLVSAAATDAIGARLPDAMALVDLGEFELRGLSRPERIHAVVHPDLPPVVGLDEAPPPAGNLPAPIDQFVGRDEERILLDKALRRHRLVTVVGPGGIGKSRLALQVAAEQAGEHPSGTWVVDLADLAVDRSVPSAVAEVIGVEAAAPHGTQAIADALDRPSLIVLDTCESRLEGAAEFAEELLALQPRALVLATSREPLGARGEAVMRLDPMAIDGGARELFLTRATAADLTLSDSVDAGLVDRICAATDGVPLAIELVAGRLAVERLEDLANAVDDLDRLLGPDAARRRTGPARQRTLSDAIRWSVDALGEVERTVLARLAVFRGGWPSAAVEQVCADDAIPVAVAQRVVSDLARRSLVVTDRTHRDRQRLLDTVRDTVAQLLGPPDHNVVNRHLGWATERAETIEAMPIAERRSAHAADQANIRAAFDHSVDAGAAECAHRLVYAQANVWAATSRLDEARVAVRRALALGESPRRDAALAAAGFVSTLSRDFAAAEAHYQECLERESVDPEIRSDVLNGLVMLRAYQGQASSELVAIAEDAVTAARVVPHTNALAVALNNLAVVLSQNDNHLDELVSALREGAALERSLQAGSTTRLNLCLSLIDRLDLGEASRLLDEVRDAANDPRNRGVWWENSVLIGAERGRVDLVEDGIGELLGLLRQDEAWLSDDQLGPLARVAAEWNLMEPAHELLGYLHDDDHATRAWIALRRGDIGAAGAHLEVYDATKPTWWLSALLAEVQLAAGESGAVAGLVAPSLRHAELRGRLRAQRRLLRVLRDAAEAQGLVFPQQSRLAELDALAHR